MADSFSQASRWFDNWQNYLRRAGPDMGDVQLEAAARLAVVLLCGEQSAIRIFAAEIGRRRNTAYERGVVELGSIERDEHLHEQALRSFCEFLPKPDDQHRLRRRAQRFFAGLGRIDEMARHFGQISHLDAAVCKIMWHVEHSSLTVASPLRILAARIKCDEARHVSVSRRYATGLGLGRSIRLDDRERVSEDLVDMLSPLGSSFEVIGVDSDRLFAHIKSQRLS